MCDCSGKVANHLLSTRSEEPMKRLFITITLVGACKVVSSSDSLAGRDHKRYNYLQSSSLYSPPKTVIDQAPEGYSLKHISVLARHGARGQSKPGKDLVLYQMARKAELDQMLTHSSTLPEQLDEFLNGQNVLSNHDCLPEHAQGVRLYGNLSGSGLETSFQLGARMYRRHQAFFDRLQAEGKAISWLHSYKDRTKDTGCQWVSGMTQSMTQRPIINSLGVNDFMMRFFDLSDENLGDDVIGSFETNDMKQDLLTKSKRYQEYVDDEQGFFLQKLNAVKQSSIYRSHALKLLRKNFEDRFIDGLGNQYSFQSIVPSGKTGEWLPASRPDKYTINAVTEAAEFLYDIYKITPASDLAQKVNLNSFASPEQLQYFSYIADLEKFYDAGPGVSGQDITYSFAYVLLYDLFTSIDKTLSGDSNVAVKLRFGHAETLIPVISILGLPPFFQQVKENELYSPTHPWKAELVSPLSANLQWEVYTHQDEEGQPILIRMLHNEKPVPFPDDCVGSYRGSLFYDYNAIRECYIRRSTDLARYLIKK